MPYNFAEKSKDNRAMEKLIYTNGIYKILQLGKESLRELAEFVVRENYKHHVGKSTKEEMDEEVTSVYNEELAYADSSYVYVVRNAMGKLIGSIRVFKWDRKKPLPIQRVFGINPLKAIHSESTYDYWHVGRFAIDSFAGIPTLTLFKQLMVYAVHPIVCDSNSYMIAETDSKLLRVMNSLGISTVQLGKSKDYLASETVPVCSSRAGILPFYNHYHDYFKVS